MEDYTRELSVSENYSKKHKEFILKYTINYEAKVLKVYYANHKVRIMPYNLENELKILNLMKKQVLEYKELIEKAKTESDNYYDEYKNFIILLSGMSLYGWVFLLSNEVKKKGGGLILTIIGTTSLIIALINNWKDRMVFEDLEKNLLFLENEEKINKFVTSNIENLECLSDQALLGLTKLFDDTYCYNINSVRHLRLNEIKKIISIVEEEKGIKTKIKGGKRYE